MEIFKKNNKNSCSNFDYSLAIQFMERKERIRTRQHLLSKRILIKTYLNKRIGCLHHGIAISKGNEGH